MTFHPTNAASEKMIINSKTSEYEKEVQDLKNNTKEIEARKIEKYWNNHPEEKSTLGGLIISYTNKYTNCE